MRSSLRATYVLMCSIEPAGWSDEALLQAYLEQRDGPAFSALVRRHGPAVWRACRMSLPHHDAEEAFQATFLVLARKAASLRDAVHLSAWLHAVARRAAQQARRNLLRRRARDERLSHMRPLHASGAVSCELTAEVADQLNRLPARYREVLWACDVDGKSRREAARDLGCPEGTVAGRLARARRLLGRRLRQNVGTRSSASPAIPPGLIQATVHLAQADGQTATGPALALANQLLGGVVRRTCIAAFVLVGSLAVVIAGTAGLCASPPALAVPPAAAEDRLEILPPRLDPFGDPLPPGAVQRFGCQRLRHDSAVWGVAFAPDGKVVASCGMDGTVRLWDAATGEEVRRFLHENSVKAVAFSPDGRTLASCGDDCKVRVWDAATGAERFSLTHPEPVESVKFSPNGKTLASGDRAGGVRIWDAAKGTELRAITEHQAGVAVVAFSPDGQTLAVANSDKTVRLWNPATGEERSQLTLKTAAHGVTFRSDGKVVATLDGDGLVQLWDAATCVELRQIDSHLGCEAGVTFTPDGKALASVSNINRVSLWNAETGKELQNYPGHASLVASIAISADGKMLATAGDDHRVRLWDLAAGRELRPSPGHQFSILAVAFSADGKSLLSVGGDRVGRIWDASTGKERLVLRGSEHGIEGAAIAPDGKQAAMIDRFSNIRLWSLDADEDCREIKGELEEDVSKTHQHAAVAYSPDGRTLAATGLDNLINLWRTSDGALLKALKGHSATVVSLAFSPDGKALASGSADESVRLWDVAAGKELMQLAGHEGPATTVVFAPDGKTLATAAGSIVRVWDAASGKELPRLRRYGDPEADLGSIANVAYSPDGKTLAVKVDNRLTLWETAVDQPRLTLESSGSDVFAWSPDGKTLACAQWNHTILLWSRFGPIEAGRQRWTANQFKQLWSDLSDEDADRAYRAMGQLATTPDQTVSCLGRLMIPAPAVAHPERFDRWVQQLDSKEFSERDEAASALEGAGEEAEGVLRAALKRPSSLELRQRLTDLLDRLGPQNTERSRARRAIELLELLGGGEARRCVERLGGGAEDRQLTREAREVLARWKNGAGL